MEFIAYLDTTNAYTPSNVVQAFLLALNKGEKALREEDEIIYANIIREFINNYPIIEQEDKRL
jgi:hypothetical protein